LVKHPGLERIVMVEIDQAVIDVCRETLPSVSDGAFDDPRVELVVGDAFAYFRDCQSTFDLVVADSTDVYEGEEGNLSEMLFTEAFYRDVARCLKPTGLLVTQADNVVFCPYSLEAILGVFGQVFPATGSYFGLVPSFGGYSGFAWASHGSGLAVEMPTSGLDLRYLTPTTWALARHGAAFG
jgi:spermidine synthase